MNILITGGAGYLGRSVAMMLQQAGHKVRIFDNGMFGRLPASMAQNMEMVPGDLRIYEDCAVAVKDQEVLIHLAEIGPRAVVESHLDFAESCNSYGTRMLAKAVSRAAIKLSIIGSWLGSLGKGEEALYGRPWSVLMHHRYELGANSMILRFPYLFGTYPMGRFRFDQFPNLFLARAIQEKEVVIPSHLNEYMLSVIDASFAIKTVIDKWTGAPGISPWFDVGHEELRINAQGLKDTILELVPDCNVRIIAEKLQDHVECPCNFDSFRSTFGWNPQITLRQGGVDIQDALRQLPSFRWTDPIAHNEKLVKQICGK